MTIIPRLALSVRQPWAWAIIHGGKDIENRDWRRPNPGLNFRGEVAIHASSGMTRREYEDAADAIIDIIGRCPAPHELVRGGIIGMVTVVDVVRKAECPAPSGRLPERESEGASNNPSPWFFGPVGLVLRDPVACAPVPAKGALGFFEWHATAALCEPAKWMLLKASQIPDASIPVQKTLI